MQARYTKKRNQWVLDILLSYGETVHLGSDVEVTRSDGEKVTETISAIIEQKENRVIAAKTYRPPQSPYAFTSRRGQ